MFLGNVFQGTSMAKATRRLGRGLDSLVSDLLVDDKTSPASPEPLSPQQPVDSPESSGENLKMVPVGQLSPNPLQPRKSIDDEDIASLTQSISTSGLLQPIAVRRKKDGFEIIAGERRWRAARSAGMERVPVVVHDATDEQMLELALVENLQREDLNPIDRARGYQQFCDRFDLKPQEVANRLAEDRTTVINYLRLLDLPETIRNHVATGRLSMGHARCLAGVADSGRQAALAAAVVENQTSVRALEAIIRQEKKSPPESKPKSKPGTGLVTPAHVAQMERRFEEALKTKVLIREGKRKGSGRILIDYYSLDDFERIASQLGLDLSEAAD